MTSTAAPGSLGDALNPFADALVAAAGTAGREPVGDPQVSRALQLGWLMDDVLSARAPTLSPADLSLSGATGFLAQARQLATILGTLKLQGVDSKAVVDKLGTGVAATADAAALQTALATALFGADVRLAKAYGLGRQLSALSHQSLTPDMFKQPPVAAMIAALDDLSTVLPPHAARGVANSMRRWVALGKAPDSADTLSAQCGLWRILLAGEKKGTELLEPNNYLDAAERLGAKLRATATVALKQNAVLVVLIVLLFAAGVVVLGLGATHTGTAAAGLSGVLAALGLTWKGVGGTLGKLAGELEAPLWGAEIDGAVTDAITLADQRPPSTSIKQSRAGGSFDYAGRGHLAKGTVKP